MAGRVAEEVSVKKRDWSGSRVDIGNALVKAQLCRPEQREKRTTAAASLAPHALALPLPVPKRPMLMACDARFEMKR
jgi:hypothetical protein